MIRMYRQYICTAAFMVYKKAGRPGGSVGNHMKPSDVGT